MTYHIDHAPDNSIILRIDDHKAFIANPCQARHAAARLATAADIARESEQDLCCASAVRLDSVWLPLATAYSIALGLFSHGCRRTIGALDTAGAGR